MTKTVTKKPPIPPRETKIKMDELYFNYYTKDIHQLPKLNLKDDDIEWNSDKEIKCATLDKLIEVVTKSGEYDSDLLYAFMLTYRSFCSPKELIEKLMIRYQTLPSKLNETWIKTELIPMRLRITQMIKFWIEKYSYDFDQEVVSKLNEFCTLMKKTNGESFSNTIEKSLQKVTSISNIYKNPKSDKGPKILKPPKKTDNIYEWPTKEIARQLTLKEYYMFRKIQPKECLNQAWSKDNRKAKAPNIHFMIHWFNSLSNLICFKILESKNVKERAKNLAITIQLAYECSLLNNFNATFEILSALNHSSVHRLKQTWGCLTRQEKQLYDDMNMFLSQDQNFKFLRDKISTNVPPLLPYIGLYLTDLTFLDDGNPDTVNGKINFYKRLRIASIIKDIQNYQQQPYELLQDDELQGLLDQVEYRLTNEEMYELSLVREKRE